MSEQNKQQQPPQQGNGLTDIVWVFIYVNICIFTLNKKF